MQTDYKVLFAVILTFTVLQPTVLPASTLFGWRLREQKNIENPDTTNIYSNHNAAFPNLPRHINAAFDMVSQLLASNPVPLNTHFLCETLHMPIT